MKNPLLNICLTFFIASTLNSQTTVGLIQHNPGTLDDGFVLFAPMGSKTTYLIDKCGNQMKSWTSTYNPGLSCYLLSDGTLLRTGVVQSLLFAEGGHGGVIEKIDWNGNVIWTYFISDATNWQHHDVKALPNGNILAIAWESKTNTQAIAKGRDPLLTPTTIWSEQILEIQPTGTTGGNVVWEWHLWDHLIQDFDSTKTDFGAVNTNPQLLNINYKATADNSDRIHLNSIDYNLALDQILVSAHNINEIWIIDHSTSSAEAASHTGGNSGKGGDFLYRWGNPLAYNRGTSTQFFGQHNAQWIETGLPYENQIMVFNNGFGRTGGNYSTIEIINPPVDGFNYTSSLPYLPAAPSWIYNDGNPNNFFAKNISGSQQLSNGNVLFCDGPAGTFKEITESGTTLWEYINPVSTAGILTQGTTPFSNNVFRSTFYPSSYSGFNNQLFSSPTIIENSNSVSSTCTLSLSIDDKTLGEGTVFVYPNPAKEFINVELSGLNDETVSYTHL
ncbi:MAG: hypothetical protein EBR41_03260, partial [Crocinitomicaceae bacterium]|nr:hypothetical protein [Crocinitomicaceae bacterium]